MSNKKNTKNVLTANRKLAKYMETYNRLRDLISTPETRNLDLPLPKIACGGFESSGKSALLSQLLGLKLPTDSNTCTRVPVELVLTQRSEGLHARCRIRWTDPDTQLSNDARSNLTELNRSVAQAVRENNLSGVIHQLQDVILDAETVDGNRPEFSSSVAVIEIAHESVPDFTVIDLPGMTQLSNTGDLHPTLREMYRTYSEDPNTVFLVAVNCETTDRNQIILPLIRGAEERTLGILTKMDRIERNHVHWANILSNSEPEWTVGYGWFGTSCRGIPHSNDNRPFPSVLEQSLEEERRYFSRPDPEGQQWDRLVNPEQLGCTNLLNRLSDLMHVQIRQSLPQLLSNVQDLLREQDDIVRENSDLPHDVADMKRAITRLIDGWWYNGVKDDFVKKHGRMFETITSECTSFRKVMDEAVYSDLFTIAASTADSNDELVHPCFGIAISNQTVASTIDSDADETDEEMLEEEFSVDVQFEDNTPIMVASGKLTKSVLLEDHFTFLTPLRFWEGKVLLRSNSHVVHLEGNTVRHVTLNANDIMTKLGDARGPKGSDLQPGDSFDQGAVQRAVESAVDSWNGELNPFVDRIANRLQQSMLEDGTGNNSGRSLTDYSNLKQKMNQLFVNNLRNHTESLCNQLRIGLAAIRDSLRYYNVMAYALCANSAAKVSQTEMLCAYAARILSQLDSFKNHASVVTLGYLCHELPRSMADSLSGLNFSDEEANLMLIEDHAAMQNLELAQERRTTLEQVQEAVQRLSAEI